MNCKRARQLFSDHFEGGLAAEHESTWKAHVEACEACRAELAGFVLAADELRGMSVEPTPAASVQAVMTTIDEAAQGELQSRGEPVGDEDMNYAQALATRPPAMTARLLPWRAAAGFGLSALCGAAAALALWVFGDLDPRLATMTLETAHAPVAQPEPERVVTYIPVPELVEVPYEVRVDMPVEIRVEVPVETIVTRGPLFDGVALAQALDRFGTRLDRVRDSFDDALAEAARAREGAELIAQAVPEEPVAGPEASTPPPRDVFAGASPVVQIGYENGRLYMIESGPLEDVLPALITRLDDEDEEVAELVAQRLGVIRDVLAADPSLAGRIGQPGTERPRTGRTKQRITWYGSASREPEPPPTRSEQWSNWWHDHEEDVVAWSTDTH